MNIIYKSIDNNVLKKIAAKYGDSAKNHIHMESDCFSMAALHDETPVGFISAYIKELDQPLDSEKDVYIDIIEVDKRYRRQGIARSLTSAAEKWAAKEGFDQIRSWSSTDKQEALSMWRDLFYTLCPATIWLEKRQGSVRAYAVDGYYVVKKLEPKANYPRITKSIWQDMESLDGYLTDLRLLRAKDGVYVFKCRYNNKSAVLKCFEKDEYKREISNYRILQNANVPTIKVLEQGEAIIILEDIDFSKDWRMGIEDDFNCPHVAKNLADWYFNFHENGASIPELDTLYCEYDKVTVDRIKWLIDKLPTASEPLEYIADRIDKLQAILKSLDYTLTYNDFYWTNFVVRKDKAAAMMFDYNFLGKGFRYADIRNVCSSLSKESVAIFTEEYNRLYAEKYNEDRVGKEHIEKQVDNIVSTIFTLISAFEQDEFPSWADEEMQKALDGTLFADAEKLLRG